MGFFTMHSRGKGQHHVLRFGFCEVLSARNNSLAMKLGAGLVPG
jgi:hypothetical protein